jgi:selenium metabolism protein YedF
MFSLVENEVMPRTIVFVNSGVKLACEGSKVLEHLMIMEKKGVEILSCGTCLDYYKLKEKLCVGQVTNMYTILEKMTNSNKVISI